MARLLQFTDLHLRDDADGDVRGRVTERSFEEALYHAHRHHWPADLVLLTGDIGNDEFDRSYERIAMQAARWETPVLAVPGNHDDGALLRAAFDKVPLAADNVFDLEHWRVIALDSQVAGKVHGELSDAMWRLLEDAAATRGTRHLLVALHHHPLSLHSHWLENLGLRDAERFRATLARLGARACVFGHAHQEWDSEEYGVRYLCTPSTGRQFKPRTLMPMDSDAPPGYRWLQLNDDGSFETAVTWLETASA